MATIGVAKAVGLEHEIGSLEVGKKAYLAILNLNDFHMYPSDEVHLVSRVVYSATRADVETTIINGKIVIDKSHYENDLQRDCAQGNEQLNRTLAEAVAKHCLLGRNI